MVYEITDESFEAEVANCDKPCVIEFTAGWCTMCDEMVPTFEELAEQYGDEVKFCIVNTDEQKKLRSSALHQLQKYGIDTTDWTKVNAFCQDARIAGKPFKDLNFDELAALTRKMRAINHKRENEHIKNQLHISQ